MESSTHAAVAPRPRVRTDAIPSASAVSNISSDFDLGAAWRENGLNGAIKCAQIKKETTGKQWAIAAKHHGSIDYCHDGKKTFSRLNYGFDQNTKTNRESVTSSEKTYQHIVSDVAAGTWNVSFLRFREIDFSRYCALTSIPEEQRETQVEFHAEQ
jgi:hypothetical protein